MGQDIQEIFSRYMDLECRRDRVALTEADEEEWCELKRALNLYFQPDLDQQHADRRKSLRVPTRLELRYESYSDMGESLLTLLSRGGVFIPTAHPLPVGTRLSLHIDQERDYELQLVGTVVSNTGGGDSGGTEAGMGVAFEPLGQNERKVLDDLYQQAGLRAVGLIR